MEPNYFTCTLGQAASLGIQQPYQNINDFVDAQAAKSPHAPAVGFPRLGPDSKDDWDYLLFTFRDVLLASSHVAATLISRLPQLSSERQTVALISPSTPEFLFTWLALMRLGHAVLLIAPQCQPAAIVNLCKTCEVSLLFYGDAYQEQAAEASRLWKNQTDGELKIAELPFSQNPGRKDFLPSSPTSQDMRATQVQDSDVAYLHHTSGTSSGMPKPIPQTHRAGLGVLPSFSEGYKAATFTTTPLYHGGIADLFRAWTSGALIWLFPGVKVPISAANIVRCLETAERVHHDMLETVAPVKYFSSVPYVLQMLETNPKGLEYLRGMAIVGVGGAALPPEVGDRLVESGVNLISRFGSAECGFLLSSHRDFTKDSEWQYLRHTHTPHIGFEAAPEGLAELIVTPGWPHMAKRNREDGSLATADLFAPHPTIENAWRYHSRADSQLTLITGKKFDPAPVEAAVLTAAECRDLLCDVLIFGNGKPYPGILLFRSQAVESMSDEDVTGKVWEAVNRLNAETQDHARILRNMLIPMRVLDTPLEKSSKGTILRGAVEQRFVKEIEGAYTGADEPNGKTEETSDEELSATIKQIIEKVVHKNAELTETTNLFSYGVDSVAGMQIRHKLRRLLPAEANQLPINVVEDCGDVEQLAQYIKRRRHGQSDIEADADVSEHAYMLRLVDEYSKFRQDGGASWSKHTDDEHRKDVVGEVVILTGATGALGAHVLDQYRAMKSVSKIYCLVRGADQNAANERVNKALIQRRLQSLDDSGKVEIVQAQLNDPYLGLEPAMYDKLASEATIIMHVAWSVNFRMKLRSFVKDSIAGVTHLINLALASPSTKAPPRFGFCSSVASMMAYKDGKNGVAPEIIVHDPASATALGYSKSKWVAEHICQRAHEQTALKGGITIFRVGQLAGDSIHGVWNMKEAYPLMLSAVGLTGSLPLLEHESVNWLPVDIAATALIEGAQATTGDTLGVFHIINPHTVEPTWSGVLQWMKEQEAFEPVSPAQWVHGLELAASKGSDHPALQLLDFWKKAYLPHHESMGASNGDLDQSPESSAVTFAMTRTEKAIPSLQHVKPVDKAYFDKLWAWVKSEM